MGGEIEKRNAGLPAERKAEVPAPQLPPLNGSLLWCGECGSKHSVPVYTFKSSCPTCGVRHFACPACHQFVRYPDESEGGWTSCAYCGAAVNLATGTHVPHAGGPVPHSLPPGQPLYPNGKPEPPPPRPRSSLPVNTGVHEPLNEPQAVHRGRNARSVVFLLEGLLAIPAMVVALTLYVSGPTHAVVVGLRIFVFVVLWVALTLIAIAILKGRWKMVLVGALGLIAWGLGSLLWLYAALSLAKPGSWWARNLYGPGKLARAAAKFGPRMIWSKMCARCGHGFTTSVPTALLCDRCRGVPQPADMIIPMGLAYMAGRHSQPGS